MADQRRSGDGQPAPLLHDPESGQEQQGALNGESADRSISWLTLLGFFFLTVNSFMAVFRAEGDPGAIWFVAASYVDLVLLFVCLRLFERTPRDSSTRKQLLKMAVWTLTTLLTVAFASRVAAVMPLPMAALVCLMTAVALVGIYNAFSVHRTPEAELRAGGAPLHRIL
ncbi:unnamed protein product [Urochloa humidicola]